ncbi:MAG: carboxymuconolactone decarboxylase family protein [Methanobacterium sp.]|jgi:AhpD family alkylhydroperoxidase|nr:carboxymuconolactone decarboxylase family protein [Methanobacterium sp.]
MEILENNQHSCKAQVKLGKKLYSVKEAYWISYQCMRTMKYMYRTKKNKELSPKFIERIMLKVTEVNECDICSYAHAKMALEKGMSNEEIQKLLAGIMEDVPEDELTAVLFAQHYADTRGHPTKESWKRLIEIYGLSRAKGILGSIRTIMMGNAYGIPISSSFNRLKGKPDKRSSFRYEISMLLGAVLIPISLIHALISDLLRKPII